MKKRDAATAPNMGDRVAYVIVKGAKGTAAYEKSEDPIYVLENNIPIDTQYYLENQLSKPLMRIFEPILDNPTELLQGDHTRAVKISAPSMGAMAKFTVKLDTCLGCKATLKKGSVLVCDFCRPKVPEIYLRHQTNLCALEEQHSRLWTQCQRCQGSLHQDVLCTSRDCPIFYMRKKVQKDVEEASKLDEKFSMLQW
jgi:DNA polymerase delta subunit 1